LSDAHFDTVASDRLQCVMNAQKRLGMNPREDSTLTYRFAVGEAPEYMNDPLRVARELVIVDRIYKHTTYGLIIQDVMRGIAYYLKEQYSISWTQAWDVTRFYAPTMLKMYCVKHSKTNLFPDML